MKLEELSIKGLIVITPDVYKDDRGFFFESYTDEKYNAITNSMFCQDNISCSTLGTIRGLHYQIGNPQGKLIQCIKGMIFDVVVDLRHASPTFGRHEWVILTEKNKKQFWIPPGFAHGFMALDNNSIIQYKCTKLYYPAGDKTLLWNDPDIGIKWPHCETPLLSEKDSKGLSFAQIKQMGFTL